MCVCINMYRQNGDHVLTASLKPWRILAEVCCMYAVDRSIGGFLGALVYAC